MRANRTRCQIPDHLRLPNLDKLERLSGPDIAQQQLELFPEPLNDSRGARQQRILRTVPGLCARGHKRTKRVRA
jgi:hypothetical protein